ncbi:MULTISPECIES: DUF6286 domain-containing protein [Streptomyces]|uniref:DUF6286 domain-containing protein n=1 Tax=Streptomyces sviceus (strain ATCC 29083 / DSM 924 / JCM 4929 / NBRC 13980 / NCIMB 11184 / NRRL 5439 / UC 5370) TaxID=463191 RepID=B5HY40_STRX2|nr:MULTISPECIES: DUF6286 domain-containing protein [Streptomyces]EDY57745.1 conserved hypothetical protein [Streptomyces sviceus ATCC 29083]MYT07247.1 hypothetical protein [Streptomyces sp. SID5470]
MSAHASRQPTGDSDLSSGPGQTAPPADGTPGTAGGATDRKVIDGSGRSAHRFWSSRRIPAALAALLSAVAVGFLLYDVIAVRAGRDAMRWRRRLAEELATRPLDDVWMIVGAAVAMVLGLWLFLLAVTPGLRRLLPMRQPTGISGTEDVRAGLDRRAAALVLRDRAMRVSGVQSAQVDVGRRKVRARARAHFRDLEEVRADLDAELGEAMASLGLARQPTLAVRVHRPKKG